MREGFHWSDVEEEILIQAVKEADTVREGLEKAAEVLETTFYICRNRWYKHTQPRLARLATGDLEVTTAVEVIRPIERETTKQVKDILEDFLKHLSMLVDDNKALVRENNSLRVDNEMLVKENRELRESYEYLLRIIDRARKLCLEDEERPDRIRYVIKDGAVEIDEITA